MPKKIPKKIIHKGPETSMKTHCTKFREKWRSKKVFEKEGLRVRVVEYSPGYMADHWCPRGHVLYVLEGKLVNELQDGTKTVLVKGKGFIVGDDEKNQHRVFTEDGAIVLIVD